MMIPHEIYYVAFRLMTVAFEPLALNI